MDDVRLFRFGYTWPSELAWSRVHPEHDLGETTGEVFVRAATIDGAVSLGEAFAEEFVRRAYGRKAYSWRELGFASWIEAEPEELTVALSSGVPVIEFETDIAMAVSIALERTSPPS